MDPLDKLELILNSEIKKKKKEFERGKGKGMDLSYVYLYGEQRQIDSLEEVLGFIHQIKRNTHSMSDEIVLRMYGAEK